MMFPKLDYLRASALVKRIFYLLKTLQKIMPHIRFTHQKIMPMRFVDSRMIFGDGSMDGRVVFISFDG